ncbi:MAG TPA: M56 family metallopeptidase [Lysobacter sp.]
MTELAATLVPALGRVLIDFLWQGLVIGAVAAFVLHALRDTRPQLRYAVACLALLACVLVPAIGLVARIAAASAPLALATMPGSGGMPVAWAVFDAAAADTAPRLDALLPWIVTLWAAGAGSLSLRMGAGLLWIARLRATPQAPAHAAWQARLDALALRFGLRRRIDLRLVDGLDSPVSAGWWRPVVLLPAGLLARMPVDLVEALLAHELAHIRRHDYLVNLVQSVAEALLFYHPVTWWLSRRIRIEREHVADRIAADVTGQPRRLAIALSELSESNAVRVPRAASLHLAQAAHGGHLMSRIEQLVRPGHRSARGALALPLIGAAVACLAFYAHAQIGDGKAAAQPAKIVGQVAAAPQAEAKPQPAPKARAVRRADYDTYALISKDRDGITMSGSTDDIDEIRQARRSLANTDFIWTRVDGKAYVISDADTYARVEAAWRDSRKLDARMDALDKQMEVHSDRMDALSRKMEQLTPKEENTSAMDAASRRMEELGEQQAALAERQAGIAADMARADASEQQRLSAKIDALSAEQDALGRQMDQQSRVLEAHAQKMDANSAPMEALGRQMDEASKPMEALGRQMEALGQEQEKLANEAERITRKLIDDAIARGLARPAPVASAQ